MIWVLRKLLWIGPSGAFGAWLMFRFGRLQFLPFPLLAAIAVQVYWRRWPPFPVRARRAMNKIWGEKREEKPGLRRVWRNRYSWTLGFWTPVVATASRFNTEREALEKELRCSIEVWERDGLVWLRCGIRKIPDRVEYEAFYGRA